MRKKTAEQIAAYILIMTNEQVTANKWPGAKPNSKVTLICLECGKIFKVSVNAADPHCPKCHSVDWDVN